MLKRTKVLERSFSNKASFDSPSSDCSASPVNLERATSDVARHVRAEPGYGVNQLVDGSKAAHWDLQQSELAIPLSVGAPKPVRRSLPLQEACRQPLSQL